MKLKFITLVLFSTFTLPTAFATGAATTPNTSSNMQQTNTTSSQQVNAQDKQKNGEVLGVLVVLNQNEIAAAELIAKKKDVNPAVKKYAKMLAKEHSSNLKQTTKLSRRLGTPLQNDITNSLKQKGQSELTTLNPLTGIALDKAYIDAMVEDHEQAIQLFDNKLLPNAGDKKLKEQLTETRKHLVKHLAKAQAIQKKLNQMNNSVTDKSTPTQ